MDATTVRNAVSNGDFGVILESLTVDERWDFQLLSFVPGFPDGDGCWARLGRVNILVQGPSMEIRAHESEAQAIEEYAGKLAELQRVIPDATRAALMAREDPKAQALLRMGMPAEMVGQALLEREKAVRQELPPVSVVRMDDGPTGFYL
jgi:hypothetical protein